MNRQTYYNRYIRDPDAKRFYNSKQWEVCRTIVLIRDNYLCQACLEHKTIRVYDVVHHIKPRKDYPALALDTKNLICLCDSCHSEAEVEARETVENGHKNINIVDSGANDEVF